MKNLIIKLILPLTIISFLIFTKWWHVLVIDGSNEFMYGFPLIYTCRGFHTSLSIRYFILEFVIDLLVYFIFWLGMIYLINRFVFNIQLHKATSYGLLAIAAISVGLTIFVMSWHENLFYVKRDFEIEKLRNGYQFIWQDERKDALKGAGLNQNDSY